MRSPSLFWRIFAVYGLLTLMSLLWFVTLLTARQRAIVFDQVREQLRTSAVLIRQQTEASLFQQPGSEPLDRAAQRQVADLGQESGLRITFVDWEGNVLADSAQSPLPIENHLERPEIRAAREQGSGSAQRTSATLHVPMLYYALRIEGADGPRGIVRVAMPLASVNARIDSVQHLVWGSAVPVSLIALTITYMFIGRLIRPLEVLTRAAQSIAEGELKQEVVVQSHGELAELAQAFNTMSRELVLRMDELQAQGRRLEENNEQLKTVLGSMIEGVVAVDFNERILLANKAAQTMLDLGSSHVVGRPIWEAIRSPTIQQVVRKALAGDDRRAVEFEIPRSQSVVALLATRLSGNPCPGVVLVLHEVTELRRLENLRHEFVSNVSHELKTPLTTIQAYAETLLSGAIDDPEHNREFLHRIEEQADRLHVLILDLLRLARIESGQDVFEVTTISVSEVIEDCLSPHRDRSETKGVSLIVEPSQRDPRVEADAEGLRTIVNNLIDNAINHTPRGGRVLVRWKTENGNALIEVEDTGVGISPQHLPRIFERFYRVDKARSRELGGTGLGLSIVKHLTQVFGGTVEVWSEPGVGSRFTVRLPLA